MHFLQDSYVSLISPHFKIHKIKFTPSCRHCKKEALSDHLKCHMDKFTRVVLISSKLSNSYTSFEARRVVCS
ncbi:unnamed protein product [Brassica rapa subsp. trilocularis]